MGKIRPRRVRWQPSETAAVRLQPSLRTALFAGNPLMHAQILANIRAMGERIRNIGQDASMPAPSVFSAGWANDC
jgi:hypothetical protein